MKKIALNQGKFALIDNEDFERISQYHWCFDGRYVIANPSKPKNIIKRIYLHRLIMNTIDGFETDHINRNKLDNRKINLRVCTHIENSQHKILYNKYGYKGISFMKENGRTKKWRSRIKVNTKEILLGYFLTAEKAAKAYNNAATKYFGKFAILNSIV
jgi:hypothetical protein